MPHPPPAFTKGQRNHLEVILGSLITEAEELMDWSRDLPGHQDPEQSAWLEGLNSELADLASDLRETAAAIGIQVLRREVDPRRKLAAWSSTWWAHVLDCRPSALKAYGSVDPAVVPLLDPAIQRIAERLLHIERGAQSA